MKYLELWQCALEGIAALILAIFLPILWMLSQLLPYGLTCLFTGKRLKKEYQYFYVLPRCIKELTLPLRRQTE